MVIYDVAAGTYWRSDTTACATRLSPASTFKIPHALIALETGVITPQTHAVVGWDEVHEPAHPGKSRMRWRPRFQNSVLWFFQRTAVKIGPDRMRGFLEKFGYGNTDTSGPADRYWINGRLQISADEQVAFLRRFYARELGIAAEHMDAVSKALVEPPGGVQNSTGVHTLTEDVAEGGRAQWKDRCRDGAG